MPDGTALGSILRKVDVTDDMGGCCAVPYSRPTTIGLEKPILCHFAPPARSRSPAATGTRYILGSGVGTYKSIIYNALTLADTSAAFVGSTAHPLPAQRPRHDQRAARHQWNSFPQMSFSYTEIAGGRLSIHSLYGDDSGKRRQELSDLKDIETI
ncbi:MAG: hypothetical protein ALECFALPRED_009201 [Alectoria fallacina]|uniref:Uncharacterized protein n=1 Tax=Alectoria fallacina TaxID=1903189 RepID=A0A8H3EWY7_9LECA|nr:MAG: hypothetical protein ALECFALPRED_009201 [Alectoria fallacina]